MHTALPEKHPQSVGRGHPHNQAQSAVGVDVAVVANVLLPLDGDTL